MSKASKTISRHAYASLKALGERCLWLQALLFISLTQIASAGGMFVDGLEDATASDITWLGDEFDAAETLPELRRIWQVEHWPFDAMQQFNINQTLPGRLTMQPYSSGWWQDYRAELSYKELSGDLIATTLVYPRNASGAGAPGSTNGGAVETEYSLAGLMLRAPRRDVELSNSNWARGREAYVFLSMGAADQPGQYQFEDKTTRAAINGEPNSISVRLITNAAAGTNAAYLRLIRVGPHILLLMQPAVNGANWRVLRRFRRDDFPTRMQLGFVAYTDWASMRACTYEFHNNNRLLQSCDQPPNAADPDLRASFEFLRVARPVLPANFVGADLSNAAAVSDAQLLAVFAFAP